jgi:phage/plasmid-associated DNA primase
MTTNELPEIKSIDGGTWRRIRVVDFMSKFVENPDPSNPYEFKLDTTLKDKISQWAPAFVSYLIHIYTTMYDIPNKDPEPAEVRASTDQYRKEQDLYREFYDTCFEISNEKKDGIKKRELYPIFKDWFKKDHGNEPAPKSKAVIEYFDKVLKLKYSNTYGYIGLNKKQDEQSSGDEQNEERNDLDD